MEETNLCPVGITIGFLSGKYKALILWYLSEGTLRFSELTRKIPDATPKMLTQQLRELERDGLLLRTVYPVIPPKVEYTLSDRGQSLMPLLREMYRWGSDWLSLQGKCPHCGMTPPAAQSEE